MRQHDVLSAGNVAGLLPPAIRPGLHCGAHTSPSSRGLWSELPPAIRPGLHCGSMSAVGFHVSPVLPPAIRPGLHCGDAEWGCLAASAVGFPRPSGRGSIAARRTTHSADSTAPSFPRPSGRGSIAAPGRGSPPSTTSRLPPAIRPGLHCGVAPPRGGMGGAARFPRPSGRGSIAATARVMGCSAKRAFPRPSGRGSIAAPSPSWRRTRSEAFPRPSGRGSITATAR